MKCNPISQKNIVYKHCQYFKEFIFLKNIWMWFYDIIMVGKKKAKKKNPKKTLYLFQFQLDLIIWIHWLTFITDLYIGTDYFLKHINLKLFHVEVIIYLRIRRRTWKLFELISNPWFNFEWTAETLQAKLSFFLLKFVDFLCLWNAKTQRVLVSLYGFSLVTEFYLSQFYHCSVYSMIMTILLYFKYCCHLSWSQEKRLY